jgi:hypothetical protein
MGTPSLELIVIDRRRLFLIAVLAIAPAIAACGSITGNDDPPPPPPPADSTGFKDIKVWG